MAREELEPLYDSCTLVGSDISWVNLWIWRKHRPIFVFQTESTAQFLTQNENGDFSLFGPPLGPLLLSHIPVPIQGLKRQTTASIAPLLEQGWSFACSRDHADYVYRVSDLATLPGGHYARKRQLIHHLQHERACSYASLTVDDVPAVESFYHQCLKDQADDSFEREWSAGKELFHLLPSLPFRGGVLWVDDELAAFVIGNRLSGDTFLTHLGKGKYDIHGAFPLLMHQFAQEALVDYRYLNFEQDLGLPGLRTAKERFYPTFQVVKWHTTN